MNSTVAFTGAPNTAFLTQGDSLPTNWANAKLGLIFLDIKRAAETLSKLI